MFGDFAEGLEVGGVDCRDDGEVVLVFVEVLGGGGEGGVERVGEGGIEGAEGEFVDLVGEIELCITQKKRPLVSWICSPITARAGDGVDHLLSCPKCSANSIYPWPLAVM